MELPYPHVMASRYKTEVTGHCFTDTETTQTYNKCYFLSFNKMFGPNASLRLAFIKDLGCFSVGKCHSAKNRKFKVLTCHSAGGDPVSLL